MDKFILKAREVWRSGALNPAAFKELQQLLRFWKISLNDIELLVIKPDGELFIQPSARTQQAYRGHPDEPIMRGLFYGSPSGAHQEGGGRVSFRVGDAVKVRQGYENESYDPFRDKILFITHIARGTDEHPGYDASLQGMALYDFETEDGVEVGCSLYEWEIEEAVE